VYQLWEYVPNNYVQELDEFINDLNLTDSSYDIDDFYPNILDSLKWNSSLGHRMGKGSILAVPMGFEQYVLAYNKRIFAERGLKSMIYYSLVKICTNLTEKERTLWRCEAYAPGLLSIPVICQPM
ncbi:MAG: hypothetical protein AB2401_04740, partial [Bacillus sp. (in: firmicutes)]